MANKNVNQQLSRMKAMMTYGLAESKQTPFSDVEYSRLGADGNLYGIVREGTKYYIKSAASNAKPIKESFEYIGGFVNRKNNEFDSYAKALKQFDLKMASLKEANAAGKNVIIESWNPDKKQMLTVESTNQMRREIARERQIMYNVARINENKAQECGDCGDPFCKDGEYCGEDSQENLKGAEKANVKKEFKAVRGAMKKANFPKDGSKEVKDFGEIEEGYNPIGWNKADDLEHNHTSERGDDAPFTSDVMGEEADVLGWNEDEDYLDTTHGTEIGDSAPFTQGKKQVSEAITDFNNNVNGGAMPQGQEAGAGMPEMGAMPQGQEMPPMGAGEMPQGPEAGAGMPPMGGAPEAGEMPQGQEMPPMGGAPEMGAMPQEDKEESAGGLMGSMKDVTERMDRIEDTLFEIGKALGVEASDPRFNDGPLYPEEPGSELQEEGRIYESRDFKRMMAEERLDYFGEHPAWRKKVMSLPTHRHQEFPDYYDMNDESVKTDEPYAQKIGSGAPFEIDPVELENAIAEAIQRNLKKK